MAEKRFVVVGGHRFRWSGLKSVEGTNVFRGALILYCHSRKKQGSNDPSLRDAWYLQSPAQKGDTEPTDEELMDLARKFYEKLGAAETFHALKSAEAELLKWVPEGCPCMETT